MIHNTRNRSNDTTESQKKKTCLNAHFQYSQLKMTYTSQYLCVSTLRSFLTRTFYPL